MQIRTALVVTVGLAALATPAYAQQTDAERKASSEIVVTAQKREQNVQDVPVAVTVVTERALESVGGTRLQDLAKLSPGLTISQGDQPGNNSILMRGIGTFALSIGVEPAVLVVVDDVAMGLQAQGFNDLADIERVEVLRGPQSTLFGKAASAGVISITTRAPSDVLTAQASLMLTDDDEQRYAVSLSGPLFEGLSFRANATIGRFDGNVKELTTGRWINGRASENYRFKLRYEPRSDFDATLIAYYNKSDQDCCASVPVVTSPGAIALFSFTPFSVLQAGITPSTSNRQTRVDPIPTADARDKGASLNMNVELGDHTVTSITALSDYILRDRTDSDLHVGPLRLAPIFGPLSGLTFPQGFFQVGSYEADTLSQEVRVTSPNGPFQYLVGAYFAANDYRRTFYRNNPLALANWVGSTSSDTIAFFGQGEVEVVPGTRLLGGLRWSREKIRFQMNNMAAPVPFFTSGSDADAVVTGKAGVQQDVAEDIMLFATYSRGYKGQAFDLTSSFNRPNHPARNPVGPESSDSFEIGMKGSFLDNRVTLNIVGFHTDYQDFQAQTLDFTNPIAPTYVLASVGSLRTRGVEAELLARPLDVLQLSGSVAYTDAIIKSYPQAPCYTMQTAAQGCVPGTPPFQDLAGKRLNNAPEWKFHVAADVNVPLPGLPVNGVFNANYSWQSKVNFAISQDPLSVQESYGVFNASIGIEESENKRYRLEVFVRNLFNKHYFSSLGSQFTSLALPPAVLVHGLPARDSFRFFGLRASVNY